MEAWGPFHPLLHEQKKRTRSSPTHKGGGVFASPTRFPHPHGWGWSGLRILRPAMPCVNRHRFALAVDHVAHRHANRVRSFKSVGAASTCPPFLDSFDCIQSPACVGLEICDRAARMHGRTHNAMNVVGADV